jgi:aspartyl-tRNA(Asn)/glutamyl-tRNA(Gln) amidotransferase subunit A
VITQAGMAWVVRDRNWRGEIDDYYASLIEAGSRLSAADYVQALADLRDVQAEIGAFFESYDLLISPVVATVAGRADEPVAGAYTDYTGFANTAGTPAISFPAGMSEDGLPIGVQVVGRFGADRELLQIAAQHERDFPFQDQWPPI